MPYTCPHCDQPGISESQKLFLVPWRVVRCHHCGKSVTTRWSGTFWVVSSVTLFVAAWLEDTVFKGAATMQIVVSLVALGIIGCMASAQPLVPIAADDVGKLEQTPTGGRLIWLVLLGLLAGIGLIAFVFWRLL